MEAVLSHEAFKQSVNTKFQIPIAEESCVELELTEVSELKLYPQQEEFSIVFRGPLESFLDQGIQTFDHEKLGQFELFLVPIRQDEHGFYYEAVFNRLREQS
ncbi:MAG TPA: hypothetical protein VLB68_27460 [Pyrinomonadaceae bacterium]|nr:hypothetical protein [Pyrinomonadaceae bacterium]